MHTDDIKRIHIADLRTKYGNQGLDIVGRPPFLLITSTPTTHRPDLSEMRAIYACLPVDFDNDGDGKKVWSLLIRSSWHGRLTVGRPSGAHSSDKSSRS
jgi:hypothetical protein